MEVDYLIVGFGIAGMSLAFQLQRNHKTIAVIDGNNTKASMVAAGLYNPVILRRFTLAWDAQAQMRYAKFFYKDLSVFLNKEITIDLPIYRKFNSAEEQNNWFSSIDHPQLSRYLSPYLCESPSENIKGDFKFGVLKHTGRLLISPLFSAYSEKLIRANVFVNNEFDFEKLEITNDGVTYGGIKAQRIVFCEGHHIQKNPFFNYLPLIGNKGSYLIFKCPNLKLKVALKSYYFIIPLGNHHYKFGATYGNHFKAKEHDKASKQELISRLDKLIDTPYEIIAQVVGVRPTIKDRRPLLGQHPKYKQLFVMNGMGTRGVLLAPTAANKLYEFMENNTPLPADLDISRFV